MTDFDNSNPAPACQQRGLMTEAELDALVERLQSLIGYMQFGATVADAITALRAERDELRAAIFGSGDYCKTLRNGNFVEMAQATEAGRKGAVARALAAEARHANPADFRYWEGRYRDEKVRAEAAEARVAEPEADNKNYAEQLSSAVETAEAAALERAANYLDTHAIQSVSPSAIPTHIGDAGWSHDGMKYAEHVRALITPAARRARLDAATGEFLAGSRLIRRAVISIDDDQVVQGRMFADLRCASGGAFSPEFHSLKVRPSML